MTMEALGQTKPKPTKEWLDAAYPEDLREQNAVRQKWLGVKKELVVIT